MIRRTWCHHLIVDFLFVHPRIAGQEEPVRGVGLGILQGICFIAQLLKCKRVWGEATRDSAPFYEKQLGRKVADSFYFSARDITLAAQRLSAKARMQVT